MADKQVPWMWKNDRTVTLELTDGQKDFKLLPADPAKLEHFRRDLAFARNVTLTLQKGRQAFENGTAEYTNAVRRLKKLTVEFGKALDEQLAVAQGIGVYFVPAGIEKEFGDAVDLLTRFCAETIEHLRAPRVEAQAQAPKPSVDVPEAAEPEPAVPEVSAEKEPAIAE